MPRPSIVICHATKKRSRNLYWVKAHNEFSRSPFSRNRRSRRRRKTRKVPTKNNNKQHTWEASTNSDSRVVTMLEQILFFLLREPRKTCLRVYWHFERTSHSREGDEEEEKTFAEVMAEIFTERRRNAAQCRIHVESSFSFLFESWCVCFVYRWSALWISIRFRRIEFHESRYRGLQATRKTSRVERHSRSNAILMTR